MRIRWADEQDADALAQVFFDAVRKGPSPYTEAERAAWLPDAPELPQWRKRIGQLHTAVAQVDGTYAGFMTIEPGGYIDLAFILHRFRGQGVFRALYTQIEEWALTQGEPRLWTFASLTAQAPFKAMGFAVINQKTVERSGQHLRRAQMEKVLR
ncbi:MAG: GNAT family N-acetyltransferase [Roseobacter sp.]|jgi:putative acetyltransferase|nr:GNAT family N-acetyltransferase [Roseobacter sp.]